MQRWRARYAAETAERDELIHEIEVGSREVNRKHESKSEAKITRKFYADKDARVTARRARNARVRLEALERERVRRPPEPLRFKGFGLASTSERGVPIRRIPSPDSSASGLRDERARAEREERARAEREERDHRLARNSRSEPAPAPLIRADRVALAGRLRETSLKVEPGGRIMLTGPNGAGKSTLLAILARRLDPDRGELETAPSTRVGYLPQEVEFAHPDRSAERAYVDAVGFEIADAVPLTATGLLAQRDIGRPVGTLSVGQRRRLALAALVADPPDLLLLDEPTNHLSLTLVEELEEALREFTVDPESGTGLVIATHDRWLRSRWEGEVLRLTAP
ncbi:ATP-binding cassette domain-containing protein [Leucobacter tenebrionis]|nr:ATP-binding cassette domain-containing protein [Leucobacter tenebrionis]